MVDDWVDELPEDKDTDYTDDEYDYGDDYCYECGGYGDDYFINDKGELESYYPYCSKNPANDDWDY